MNNLHIHNASDNAAIRLTGATGGATNTMALFYRQRELDAQLLNQENGYLKFGTKNAEVMRLTSIGNVGIGTTGPSSRLHISGSTEPLRITSTSYTTRFYEDSNFHIAREAGGGSLSMEGWTYVGVLGANIYSNAIDGSAINYIRLGAGTVSAPTYSFYSDSNTGIYNTAADKLGLVAGGTESMTITSGNVGIGRRDQTLIFIKPTPVQLLNYYVFLLARIPL